MRCTKNSIRVIQKHKPGERTRSRIKAVNTKTKCLVKSGGNTLNASHRTKTHGGLKIQINQGETENRCDT